MIHEATNHSRDALSLFQFELKEAKNDKLFTNISDELLNCVLRIAKIDIMEKPLFLASYSRDEDSFKVEIREGEKGVSLLLQKALE